MEGQARTLEAVLEGHAAQQDKYEQLLQWRVAADGAIHTAEARVAALDQGVETARQETREGLRGAHEELRDTAAQWPEWAKAIEEAVRVLQTGKADCGSVEDACAALGERLEAVGRQLAPLPPLVGSNSSSLQQLLARFDMLEPRGDKTCAQLAEAQVVLQKFAKELLETRGQSAAQQQLLQGLIGSERASANPNPALTLP